ncbi:GspE/PulE family protein [Nocardioides daeguensis]|uniref:GspE/PulE family protein n=1 Tax=Nocardioides daeguensis TaxID=908359 RepID=A0ABP6UXS2_9ACTN|nr:GspE/PulE family protein [Nocardioides daeguensis]MBV6725970.1 Flp pilus assembly complex ATPase component TadA [Nocardioides daeguensis]MCR1772514.1 Flp pilus assembly complex ATPase component TadA [Nocardioides daeguensis]
MRLKGKHSKVEEPLAVPRTDEDDERLGRILVAAGRVQPYQLDAVRGRSGALGRRLVESGAITDEVLARTLAEHHQVGVADFRTLEPTAEALALLSRDQAVTLEALPISVDDAGVVVAVLDPAPERVAAVVAVIERPVRALVTTRRDLDRGLATSYRATQDVGGQVQAFEARDVLRREAEALADVSVNEEAPVVRVVQSIITQALRDRASDIHVEPAGERVRVRYRIDGALTEVLDLPASIGPAIVSRVKILGGMNIVERRRPQDGQISMDVDDREIDIRVSTTAVVGGEKVVMRLLDKSRSLYDLEQLGMPADTAARYTQLIHSPFGMVICAGPTGGGKTTTLYASLGELNSPEKNLMTIEDPVEYTFDSINQIQINEQAGITFAGGLKSILRQDPDVILVGEIRDVDTARIAVQSALTGHFVLSSLHATEAVSALYRLLDMGIEAFLIASSVTAVVAQRLVRRSCTSCLAPYQPSPDELAFVQHFGSDEPIDGWLHGTGCHLCAHTGYLERIGVYEMLVVTDEVRELIVDRAPQDLMRKLARNQGMRTLQEQAVRLVSDGTTTAAEVMRSIYVAGV